MRSSSASFSAATAVSGLADGLVVAAARVKSDGTLEVLRGASVAATGAFRIDSVPAGVDRLVLVAASGAGVEVGRVIVHQAVTQGQVAAAAPINSESTVEAAVFAELVKSGMPKEAINTVELARSVEVSGQATANALLASAAEIRALAEGIKAQQETYTQALAQQGISLDAAQRFQAELPAAVAYAQERKGGASETAAELRADSAAAALLRAAGASDAAQVQAAGAAETGFLRAATVADANARLDIARAAMKRSARARERVVDSVVKTLALSTTSVEAMMRPFAQAHAAADTASSVTGLHANFAAAADSAQAAFERTLSTTSSRVPAQAQARLAAALQSAPSRAALETRLAAAAGASATASAYVGFMTELRAAVEAAVAQAGGGLESRAVADLFVALRASVQVP